VDDAGHPREPARRLRSLLKRAYLDLPRVWSLGGLTKLGLVRAVIQSCQDHDLPGRAAQLSYFFLLALFPLLIFLSAVLGFVLSADKKVLNRLLGYVGSVMPWSAYELVLSTLEDLMTGATGDKVSIGLILTLWTGSSGMVAIIEGLNIAYRVLKTALVAPTGCGADSHGLPGGCWPHWHWG